MKKKSFFSAKNVTSLAILLALVIVLQAFGGSFSIGAVSLNFTLIPIVLGAMLLGPLAGALLGFACGVVVWIQVIMGLVPFYVLIWTETPVVATLTCIVKTTVAGWVAGLLFRWLEGKNRYLAVFVAAAVVPVINTGLFKHLVDKGGLIGEETYNGLSKTIFVALIMGFIHAFQ